MSSIETNHELASSLSVYELHGLAANWTLTNPVAGAVLRTLLKKNRPPPALLASQSRNASQPSTATSTSTAASMSTAASTATMSTAASMSTATSATSLRLTSTVTSVWSASTAYILYSQ